MKEFTTRNRAQHERRLRELKRSIRNHSYQVDPERVAGGVLREAFTDAAARQSD